MNLVKCKSAQHRKGIKISFSALLAECASLSQFSLKSSFGNVSQDRKDVKDGLSMPGYPSNSIWDEKNISNHLDFPSTVKKDKEKNRC